MCTLYEVRRCQPHADLIGACKRLISNVTYEHFETLSVIGWKSGHLSNFYLPFKHPSDMFFAFRTAINYTQFCPLSGICVPEMPVWYGHHALPILATISPPQKVGLLERRMNDLEIRQCP